MTEETRAIKRAYDPDEHPVTSDVPVKPLRELPAVPVRGIIRTVTLAQIRKVTR